MLPVLVGIGVDLSGSMQTNIRNNSGGAMTRLEGFRLSLQKTAENINQDLGHFQENAPPFDVFAYGFGLRPRNVPFADLFSLVKVGTEIANPDLIKRLTDKHAGNVRSEYEGRASQYGGLADVARRYLGSYVDQLESNFRKEAESEVKRRVLADIADSMAARLNTLGDTTLNIQEVLALWNQSGSTLTDAEELIFGTTLMCAALVAMKGRFERELAKRGSGTLATLFLLSGEPTDGSPVEAIKAIQSMGVTVVSCFVTDQDVATPRTLYAQSKPDWPAAAKLMFEAASKLPPSADLSSFLLRKGWTVHPDPKLFVQLNHTEVLNEFMELLALPLRRREMDWQLPAGDLAARAARP